MDSPKFQSRDLRCFICKEKGNCEWSPMRRTMKMETTHWWWQANEAKLMNEWQQSKLFLASLNIPIFFANFVSFPSTLRNSDDLNLSISFSSPMHGRVKTSIPPTATELATRDAKVSKYRALLLELQSQRVANDATDSLTSKLVQVNPDHYTAWNLRKEIVKIKLNKR